jgi:hypothetical protein
VELVGGFHGVLAGHGVGHEQDLDRGELLFQLLQLGHQLVVDVQAAGGIHQQHVAAGIDGFLARGADQVGGQRLFGRAGVDGQVDVARHHAQLLARGGTIDVHRHHQRAVAVFESQRASLPVEVVLPEPCRPTISSTLGGSLAKRSLDSWLPRILISSSRTILMTCWEGERDMSTSSPMAFCLDVFDELLDHAEVDVGFEQRHADFAQGGLHVLGRELAFAAQVLEDAL